MIRSRKNTKNRVEKLPRNPYLRLTRLLPTLGLDCDVKCLIKFLGQMIQNFIQILNQNIINNEYILGMCSISIRFFIGLDYVSVCKNHLDLIIVKNVQSFKNSREVKTFKTFRNKRCLNCRIFFKKQTFLQ